MGIKMEKVSKKNVLGEGGIWVETFILISFIQKMLDIYQKMREAPQGLPLCRGMEHAITLKEGSSPLSVRPI